MPVRGHAPLLPFQHAPWPLSGRQGSDVEGCYSVNWNWLSAAHRLNVRLSASYLGVLEVLSASQQQRSYIAFCCSRSRSSHHRHGPRAARQTDTSGRRRTIPCNGRRLRLGGWIRKHLSWWYDSVQWMELLSKLLDLS